MKCRETLSHLYSVSQMLFISSFTLNIFFFWRWNCFYYLKSGISEFKSLLSPPYKPYVISGLWRRCWVALAKYLPPLFIKEKRKKWLVCLWMETDVDWSQWKKTCAYHFGELFAILTSERTESTAHNEVLLSNLKSFKIISLQTLAPENLSGRKSH